MSGSTIAIIGGGFSGVVCAARLLKSGAAHIRKVILIEKRAHIGRGLAYGISDDSHLLNVPAGQMSAFAEDPDHFLRFARLIDSRYTAGDFLPRKLYGQYLEALLDLAAHDSPTDMELVRITDCATDIQYTRNGRPVIVTETGNTISADQVILASGNVAGRNPLGAHSSAALQSPRYINDPWCYGALERVDMSKPVLILGSGLTAVDITCSLMRRGYTNIIHMLSRRGLVALPHLANWGQPVAPIFTSGVTPEVLNDLGGIRSGLRAVRNHVRSVAAEGRDWREVMSGLRKQLPVIWRNLSIKERRRFLRHVQPYWDVHRHRLAPSVAATLQWLNDNGALQRHAGRVTEFIPGAAHIRVTIQQRHSASMHSIETGTVVNCTGLCTALDNTDDALLANLQRRGLCIPDALQLGVECADNYALVNAAGQTSQSLYYIGPLLRAKFWEATAVPELREHVAALAQGITAATRYGRSSTQRFRRVAT